MSSNNIEGQDESAGDSAWKMGRSLLQILLYTALKKKNKRQKTNKQAIPDTYMLVCVCVCVCTSTRNESSIVYNTLLV